MAVVCTNKPTGIQMRVQPKPDQAAVTREIERLQKLKTTLAERVEEAEVNCVESTTVDQDQLVGHKVRFWKTTGKIPPENFDEVFLQMAQQMDAEKLKDF